MAIAAPLFTESFGTQIDDLLMRICVELQLDETRYKLADTSYRAVWGFLERDPLVGRLNPTIYPQGSMFLDTTIKPIFGDEYDLDFVCEFSCETTFFRNPVDALDIIERALRSNDVYAPMVERMNRCIRLNYAHNFHLDILPACKDRRNGGTCILVPDRRLADWTASNPKGYGTWFEDQSKQIQVGTMMEKAAPIPLPQPAQHKPPLKLCVQLWKRGRDVRYGSDPDAAPPSIVVTTLAGLIYRGEQSVGTAMGNILGATANALRSSYPRLVVLNPSHPEEDLSERWDSRPGAYSKFVTAVSEFDAEWKALYQMRGIDKIARGLESLFGEDIAKRVMEKQAREIEAVRARSELGIKKASGILTALGGASVARIPPNTFYGEKE